MTKNQQIMLQVLEEFARSVYADPRCIELWENARTVLETVRALKTEAVTTCPLIEQQVDKSAFIGGV